MNYRARIQKSLKGNRVKLKYTVYLGEQLFANSSGYAGHTMQSDSLCSSIGGIGFQRPHFWCSYLITFWQILEVEKKSKNERRALIWDGDDEAERAMS